MNKATSPFLKWMIVVACGAGLAFFVALALRPERIPVEVTKVQRGQVLVGVTDDGYARVRERYIVYAPMHGNLRRLKVHPGDSVWRRGDPIVILDPSDSELLDPKTKLETEAKVKAAESSISRAEELRTVALESLELAEHEYQRALELRPSNAVSQAEFDTAEHRFRITRAEVRASEFLRSLAVHELEVAQAVLKASQSPPGQPMPIGSPSDGVVLRVLREDAGYVAAGTPLLEIGDPKNLEIQIDVLSTAAVAIQPGNRVEIRGGNSESLLYVKVRLVEPSAFLKISALGVEERRVLVLVDLDESAQGQSQLSDGYRVDATIIVDSSDPKSLIVPTAALESSMGRFYAYRVEPTRFGEHRVVRVEVQLGKKDRKHSEVLSGLNLDEIVVTYPPEKLQHASRVRFDAKTLLDRNPLPVSSGFLKHRGTEDTEL